MPALSGVAAVVERRQTLPILSNLLIEAREGTVVLTATDLELQVSAEVSAKVEEAGAITLPAKKFADICRALPEHSVVKVNVEGNRSSIRSGRSRFFLSVLAAEDYPSLEGEEGQVRVEVEREVLQRMLDRTSFAMGQQDVRYYLNGLLLEFAGDRFVAVGTDGHRLAKSEGSLKLGIDAEESRQVIVPGKTVSELRRLLGHSAVGTVDLEVGERTLVVRAGKTVVTTKLIDGRYPDYNRVIPGHLERSAILGRDVLKESLARTAVLSYEKHKGVRMTFDQGGLELEVRNPEQEEATEEIEIDYSGERTTIGFNVGYWLDVLNVIEGRDLRVKFMDSDVSAVLEDPNSSTELYVVMPMRI